MILGLASSNLLKRKHNKLLYLKNAKSAPHESKVEELKTPMEVKPTSETPLNTNMFYKLVGRWGNGGVKTVSINLQVCFKLF